MPLERELDLTKAEVVESLVMVGRKPILFSRPRNLMGNNEVIVAVPPANMQRGDKMVKHMRKGLVVESSTGEVRRQRPTLHFLSCEDAVNLRYWLIQLSEPQYKAAAPAQD